MSEGKIKIFFGAGRIGRRALSFWREIGLNLDFFCDNNPKLLGKKIEGVDVLPIETILKQPQNKEIFITCKDEEIILHQLLSLGIKKNQIIRYNTIASIIEYFFPFSKVRLPIEIPVCISASTMPEVIFDLSMGLVLGGVETWSIQTSKQLKEIGYSTALLVNSIKPSAQKNNLNIISAEFNENIGEWKIIENLLHLLTQKKYSYLICNFMGYFFATACLAKKLFPDNLKVITVIHNDVEVFYQDCIQMQQYIDDCLIISEKMRLKLLEKGFPKEKVTYLPWDIACDEIFNHTYSSKNEAIRIGYAGRIVIEAKRIDSVVLLAKKLKSKKINFILELAGTGTYEKKLVQEIKEGKLHNEVRFLGFVNHSEIKSFWRRQDIMISCSEHEGHSLSQCEAMSAGAIPIITDISGARDDVIDGENGFIVEIGALDEMVDKICFLYEHRELLPCMGKKAYSKIKESYSEDNSKKVWKTILQ